MHVSSLLWILVELHLFVQLSIFALILSITTWYTVYIYMPSIYMETYKNVFCFLWHEQHKRLDKLREQRGKILGSDPCCPVGSLKSQSFSFNPQPIKDNKKGNSELTGSFLLIKRMQTIVDINELKTQRKQWLSPFYAGRKREYIFNLPSQPQPRNQIII